LSERENTEHPDQPIDGGDEADKLGWPPVASKKVHALYSLPPQVTVSCPLMDNLTFIAALVHAVAWPVGAIVIVVLFREPLLRLIPALQELKAFGTEMKFGRVAEVAAVKVTAQKIIEADSTRKWDREVLKRLIIEELSRTDRLILVMHYFEDLPLSAVARSLEMRRTEVQARLNEILRELKQRMTIVNPPLTGPGKSLEAVTE
jgi:RNA polymerase sigma factor (sigma-70 family)